MKKVLLFLCISVVFAFAFGMYVEAWSVSKSSKNSPATVDKGTSAKYSLSVNYDSEIYGIPVPVDGHLGLELPCAVFASKPTYKSGSFSGMTFTKRTGSLTGVGSYQCYKMFAVVGSVTKSYNVTAKAKNTKGLSGKAYMGTGPGTITGYDYYFTVKTK